MAEAETARFTGQLGEVYPFGRYVRHILRQLTPRYLHALIRNAEYISQALHCCGLAKHGFSSLPEVLSHASCGLY